MARPLGAALRVTPPLPATRSGGDTARLPPLRDAAANDSLRPPPTLSAWGEALRGKFHAWRVAARYPIPGGAIASDFARTALAATGAGVETGIVEAATASAPARAARAAARAGLLALTPNTDRARLVAAAAGAVDAVEAALLPRLARETGLGGGGLAAGSDDAVALCAALRGRREDDALEMLRRGATGAGGATLSELVACTEPATGLTPLMLAVSAGLLRAVRRLLELGADPDGEAPTGATPLHLAWDAWRATDAGLVDARAGLRRLARALLSALLEGGADPNAPDGGGVTALHRAAGYGHDECAALLLRYGADPAHADRQGGGAEAAACAGGHAGTARLLRLWPAIRTLAARDQFTRAWWEVLGADGVAAAAAGVAARLGVGAASNTSAGAALAAAGLGRAYAPGGSGGAGGRAGGDLPSLPAAELVRRFAVQAALRRRRGDGGAGGGAGDAKHGAAAARDARRRPCMPVVEYDMEADALRDAGDGGGGGSDVEEEGGWEAVGDGGGGGGGSGGRGGQRPVGPLLLHDARQGTAASEWGETGRASCGGTGRAATSSSASTSLRRRKEAAAAYHRWAAAAAGRRRGAVADTDGMPPASATARA